MFAKSKNPTWGTALLDAMITCLESRPSGPLLASPTIHLATAVPTPILPSATPSLFTEASFTGYSDVVIASFTGPITLPSETGWGLAAVGEFVAGNISAAGQNIVGYWVDNGSTTFYLGEAFPTPLQMNTLGDWIQLTIIFGALFNAQVSS